MRRALVVVAAFLTLSACSSPDEEAGPEREFDAEQVFPSTTPLPPDPTPGEDLIDQYAVGDLPVDVACGEFVEFEFGSRADADRAVVLGTLLEDRELGGLFLDLGRAGQRSDDGTGSLADNLEAEADAAEEISRVC